MLFSSLGIRFSYRSAAVNDGSTQAPVARQEDHCQLRKPDSSAEYKQLMTGSNGGCSMPDNVTTLENEPDFAQPWAPHRLRIYTGVAIFTVAMFVLLTVGVSVGIVPPSFTVDVIANLSATFRRSLRRERMPLSRTRLQGGGKARGRHWPGRRYRMP